MTPEQYATLQRVEAKLDALIKALAEGDEEGPSLTSDGWMEGREREPGQSLG